MEKNEKHHGKHVFADFIWNTKTEIIENKIFSKTIFNIMLEAIKKTNMTIVHEKLCILGDNDSSPPGFTSIILIDESHVSGHCYSDRGWLAIDVFTCGVTDPDKVMSNIIDNITSYFPSLTCTKRKTEKRFTYY